VPCRTEWRLSGVLRQLADDLIATAARIQETGRRIEDQTASDIDVCRGACPCSTRYLAAIVEAIAVLDRTRSSFKSKELGTLRRRLEETIARRP
jgi:hypothetical protein